MRQRFDWLHDQWVSFAQSEKARVMCWRVQDDERSMLDAFFAKESDEQVGELPDLFLRVDAPFASGDSYALSLRQALITSAEAQREAEVDPALASLRMWQPPALVRGQKLEPQCIAACEHFHAHYQLPGQLALLLTPSEVADATAFSGWLAAIARVLPAPVRLVFIDSARAPALSLAAHETVVIQEASLDMPSALLQISRAAGGLHTPGGLFRHLFVAFTGALGKKDLALAEQLGGRLFLITEPQRWFALEVPVHLALGAALAESQRTNEALARYVAAEKSALAGELAGDAACSKLRMQARMVRGGLLITNKAYQDAAKLFVETLPMAEALSDARSVIDCHRLASFSQEQDEKRSKAWQHGLDALAFARTVDGETLRSSTLKFMAEGMQRIAKHAEFRAQGPRIQRDFDQLLAEPKQGAQAART